MRLSRARNTSKDAFGILSKRFRLYQRRLEVKPKYVNKIVLATCVLHNFLKTYSMTILSEVMEDEAATSSPQNSALSNLMHVGGAFDGNSYLTREKFKNYFSSPNGSVEWQVRAVQQGKQYNRSSKIYSYKM